MKEVWEETFMNGRSPWIKAEVECWETVGLVQMMKLGQRVENCEIKRREAGLDNLTEGKAQMPLSFNKPNILISVKDNKSGENFLVRTIMLRGATTSGNRREGPMKRMMDGEFQAWIDKGLSFKRKG